MSLVSFTALSDLAQLITYSWYVSLTAKVMEEVETITVIKQSHFSHLFPKFPHTWGEHGVDI